MHVVCACVMRLNSNIARELRSYLLEKMKRYNIKKMMFTTIYMRRESLITKEEMDKICKGEKYEFRQESVNDDLEEFFEAIQLGRKLDEATETFYLPELTQKELKLIEKKDKNYLDESLFYVDLGELEAKMKASESNSIYISGMCYRGTLTIVD